MQDFSERRAVRQLAFDEFGVGGEHGAMAMAEVVVDDDPMSLIEQQLSNGSTDVPGTAGYQNSQWGLL
jgi:hypothetical protein